MTTRSAQPDWPNLAGGPKPLRTVTKEPLSRLERVSAANFSAANALIPQVTHHDHADITVIDRFRKGLADEARERGLNLTGLPFHVKALARALREFSYFNESLSPEGESLVLKGHVHIAVAVDTGSDLMVPVIRDADKKQEGCLAACL